MGDISTTTVETPSDIEFTSICVYNHKTATCILNGTQLQRCDSFEHIQPQRLQTYIIIIISIIVIKKHSIKHAILYVDKYKYLHR